MRNGNVQFRAAREQHHPNSLHSSRHREKMRRYSDLLRIGPWFLIGPFVQAKGVYRGMQTSMRISLAVTFAGEVMIELIEQHDEQPSVYRETLAAHGSHGFHHWAIGARNFEATVMLYKARGYAEVFSDLSPRGVRIVYLNGACRYRNAGDHRDDCRRGGAIPHDVPGG